MFYSATQSFLNFLRILNRLEVCVFARAGKLESPCTSLLNKNWKNNFYFFEIKLFFKKCLFIYILIFYIIILTIFQNECQPFIFFI
jgi:hypothetical protein